MIRLLFFVLIVSFVVPLRAAKPNVVLYVLDDWGRDAGCFGNKIIKTPHIDALAAEGTRFEKAHCTTASCSASRSVILTGLHNHLNGQYGHQHGEAHFSAFSSVRSLPVLLGEGGYRTARIGKFHVAPEQVFKFDEAFPGNSRHGIEMAENCRAWFAKDERPFFLYICSSDPHRGGGVVASDPLKPDSFGNNGNYPGHEPVRYDPKDVIVPPWLPDTPECRAEIAQYYQAVSRADQGIGHLVKVLKETGRYDNTLIMLTADNGMPFPGSKTNLYEPGMHLPLIVRAPEQKKRGGLCHAMVSWVDYAPTILDFCGVKVPDAPAITGDGELFVGQQRRGGRKQPYTFHGRSWRGLWDEENPAGWDEVYASHTFHEIQMYYPMRVIQTRQWKLILNIAHPLPYPFASDLWASATWQSVATKGESRYGGRAVSEYLQRPRYELYDKQADPEEFKNLAADPAHKAIFEELAAKLKTFQQRTRDPWVVKYEHE